MIKKCCRCSFEGDEKLFVSKKNLCKTCHNKASRIFYNNHKESESTRKKIYNAEYIHRPEVKARHKKYKQTDKYKEYARNYIRNRLKVDIIERLKYNTRNRIRISLKKHNESSAHLIGCPMEQFKEWLEFNFDENMTWENYGSYWHMDHLWPCASFDLYNKEQRFECFNWTNVVPMEGVENLKKHSKICPELIKFYDKRLTLFTDNFIEQHIDDW